MFLLKLQLRPRHMNIHLPCRGRFRKVLYAWLFPAQPSSPLFPTVLILTLRAPHADQLLAKSQSNDQVSRVHS